MTLHLPTHRMDWKLLFLNFNQTLNSKPQNHIQNWSFEDSNLIIPLPESLLHNVDMEKLQNMNQPVLDNIHHGTIHSTIPKNHSMTTAQMQVHSEATLQDKTIDESQTSHDLIRARVIAKIKEVELKGGPKRFKPQSLMVDPRPIRKPNKKHGKQQESKSHSHNSK